MDGQANKDLNVLKEAWLRLKCGKIARMLGGVFGLFENGGLAFVLYERTGQPLHLHRGTLLGQAAIRNYRIESGGNFRRHRTRTQHLALREGRLKNG